MNMRKLGVVGSFAAGAAFALAPLASADTSDFDFSSLLASEVASANSSFDGYASITGIDAADITHGTPPLGFDTIAPGDMNPQFSDLVFGFNPANVSSDPGAYDVLNGATIQFDDGFNSLLYASMNDGAVLDWDSGDLFGGSSAMDIATNATTGWGEASDFFQAGVSDLIGYF